jgi:hypothetical protein
MIYVHICIDIILNLSIFMTIFPIWVAFLLYRQIETQRAGFLNRRQFSEQGNKCGYRDHKST